MRKLICYVLSNKCCNVPPSSVDVGMGFRGQCWRWSRRCSRRICPFSRGVRRCCCRNCCRPPAAVRRLLLTLSATFVAFRPALSPRFATEFPGIWSRIVVLSSPRLKAQCFRNDTCKCPAGSSGRDRYRVTVFRGTDCRPNVPERDALYVNSSAIDLAEVIQERANR